MRGTMLALVVIAVIVSVGNGDTSPSQCKEERRLITSECKPVIFGQEPSASCCGRVRVTHLECVCPYITPKLAALIGVERTLKQIKACGRNLPHNFKCGSITFP